MSDSVKLQHTPLKQSTEERFLFMTEEGTGEDS